MVANKRASSVVIFTEILVVCFLGVNHVMGVNMLHSL